MFVVVQYIHNGLSIIISIPYVEVKYSLLHIFEYLRQKKKVGRC